MITNSNPKQRYNHTNKPMASENTTRLVPLCLTKNRLHTSSSILFIQHEPWGKTSIIATLTSQEKIYVELLNENEQSGLITCTHCRTGNVQLIYKGLNRELNPSDNQKFCFVVKFTLKTATISMYQWNLPKTCNMCYMHNMKLTSILVQCSQCRYFNIARETIA